MNGKKYDLPIDPRTTLLDCLREHLHLTGSKKGCDHGQCGACTVHINGRRQLSCLAFAALHDGDEITTIGIVAAITTATCHATGLRVRELPIKNRGPADVVNFDLTNESTAADR